MRLLSVVLWSKISLTFAVWSLPLMFSPQDWVASSGFPVDETLRQLLGCAYFALGVGYCFGLQRLRRRVVPVDTIVVGIVSNGLACGAILIAFFSGQFDQDWGECAIFLMMASAVATGMITAGLAVGLIQHSLAFDK